MIADDAPMLTGSVKQAIRELREEMVHSPGLSFPHVQTIVNASAISTRLDESPTLRCILEKVREQVASSVSTCPPVPRAEADGNVPSRIVTDHWLLSVPAALRASERTVVNYLGMTVAIDFRHWGEEEPESHDASEGPLDASARPSVVGFYTTVEDAQGSPNASTEAQRTAEYRALHVEVPNLDDARRTAASTKATHTLLRGSAAMMYLLRRAVEEKQIPWYDPNYLEQFSSVEAARRGLRECFMGCRADGQTPMWMPAAATRISVLLSVAAALRERGTSFYDLLCGSDGRLYGLPPADGLPQLGFIQRLFDLHPRYHDVAPHPLNATKIIPILKLSQLTALALQSALPALWAWQGPTLIGDVQRPGWLESVARRAAVCGSQELVSLFTDAEQLTICCDYQIPKALRDAGLLVYSSALAAKVDRGVVLSPGGEEEVAIRVAALLAVESLLDYVNARCRSGDWGAAQRSPVQSSALDYALWYIGRYPPTGVSSSRHHLCRTIMY